MSCKLEFLSQSFPGDGTAAYTRPYCSLYLDVLQLIPGGTAAYIVTCDFNETPKSDFDFDLRFVNNDLNYCKNVKMHSVRKGWGVK